MTKAADIMAAATPGPWGPVNEPDEPHFIAFTAENARAIVTAVNLFPLYEAVREAARPILERCLDFFGADDLDPESSEAMPVVIKNRWAYELRAALDALQAAEDAL